MQTLSPLLIAAIFLTAAACNTEPLNKRTQNPTPGADAIAKSGSADKSLDITTVNGSADLPDCNTDTEGKVFYVKDDARLYVCLQGSYAKVDTGKDGKDGKDGSDGKNGKDGINGGDAGDEVFREKWRENVLSTGIVYANYKDASGAFCIGYTGTGFVVGKDIVATNGHVAPVEITQPDYILLTCPDYTGPSKDPEGSQVTLKLDRLTMHYATKDYGEVDYSDLSNQGTKIDLSIANKSDLVLIQVPTGDRRPLTVSDRDDAPDRFSRDKGVYLQEKVALLGYSYGVTTPQFVIGRINFIMGLPEEFYTGGVELGQTIYGYDLHSAGGSSGGAIIDQSGEVIAINYAGSNEFGLAVQAKQLRDLLAASRNWTDI